MRDPTVLFTALAIFLLFMGWAWVARAMPHPESDVSIATAVMAMIGDRHSAVDPVWLQLLRTAGPAGAHWPFPGSDVAQAMLARRLDRQLVRGTGVLDDCAMYGRAVRVTFQLMNSTLGFLFRAPPMDRAGDEAAEFCRLFDPPPWTRFARKDLWLATTRTFLLPLDPEQHGY